MNVCSVLLVFAITALVAWDLLTRQSDDIEENGNGLECYNANHGQDLGRMQSINEVI